MIPVLYITGYGHSGSTLLDIMLGNHRHVAGVGEVTKLHRSGWTNGADRRCACGRPITACPYWEEVRRRWLAATGPDALQEYVVLQNRYQRYRPPSKLLWIVRERRGPSAAFQRYATLTAALYRAIQETSGRPIVLDSSKSPLRAYALLHAPDVDLRLLHLVRDGRGVVWSRMKPKDRSKNPEAGVPRDFAAAPAWRTTLEWTAANLQSEWIAAQAPPGMALRVTYEALCDHPHEVLGQIGWLVGEDFSTVATAVANRQPLRVGHQVAGNSIRMAEQVVFRPDTTWQQQMPEQARTRFWRMAGWLAQRYGYRASIVAPLAPDVMTSN